MDYVRIKARVPKELMLDALDTAYKDVGPKKKGK